MNTNDVEQLKKIADEIYGKAGELIAEGNRPFAVAAVFSMVSLQIYKTLLSADEYNQMVDSISNNRHSIIALTDVLKSAIASSLH